ncbi:MAG TPA: hypothetical protein PLF12_11930 [Tenuifilum sp.]|uniref:hypothetical protein n=1 Tax=Tenuifilum sp. TaxID=2760880 RepID=UPI002D151A2B|nr:hypothetical protein [Tenuifilum sp.]HOK87050.1 hypothetical protein [Tenuifilum sp.]
MKSPILHIGYPKTATKWFQNEFYPNVSGVYPVMRKDLFDRLVFTDIYSYSPSHFRGWITGEAGSKRLIICDEILVGGLDIGFGNGEFVLLMSQRLHDTFPDSQVVILIRNQHTALESAYSHYVMAGGTYSPSRFLGIKPMFIKPYMGYNQFSTKLFEYDKLIDLYISLFGKDKVHIFLYEDFAENPNRFIALFCNTLQLDAPQGQTLNRLNARYSYIALQIQRFLNRFALGNTPFKQYFINFPSIYKISRSLILATDKYCSFPKYKFDKKVHHWVELRFKESNQCLSQWVSKEKLLRWGYPL